MTMDSVANKVRKLKPVALYTCLYGIPVLAFNTKESYLTAHNLFFPGMPCDLGCSGCTDIYSNPENGMTWVIIGVFNGDNGTLGHELIHAAYFILAATGVKHDVDNHEAFTYLWTSMFRFFNGDKDAS